MDSRDFSDPSDDGLGDSNLGKALDSCPIEVIRRFINRSWRFMSAYRTGLTGKAAAWAVKKQRSHRSVPERARIAIEALLN